MGADTVTVTWTCLGFAGALGREPCVNGTVQQTPCELTEEGRVQRTRHVSQRQCRECEAHEQRAWKVRHGR